MCWLNVFVVLRLLGSGFLLGVVFVGDCVSRFVKLLM